MENTKLVLEEGKAYHVQFNDCCVDGDGILVFRGMSSTSTEEFQEYIFGAVNEPLGLRLSGPAVRITEV